MKLLTLREARQVAELSQEALATASGVEQTVISKIELGKIVNPSFATVTKLAAALDIDPRQLRFDTDTERQSRLPLKRKAS